MIGFGPWLTKAMTTRNRPCLVRERITFGIEGESKIPQDNPNEACAMMSEIIPESNDSAEERVEYDHSAELSKPIRERLDATRQSITHHFTINCNDAGFIRNRNDAEGENDYRVSISIEWQSSTATKSHCLPRDRNATRAWQLPLVYMMLRQIASHLHGVGRISKSRP